MKLVGKGQQNAVFTDNEAFYRFAHRELKFPRFDLSAINFYYPFTEPVTKSVEQICESLFGSELFAGLSKPALYESWVEIKPKSPVMYRGEELFDYTAVRKRLGEEAVNFHASEMLSTLAKQQIHPDLLGRMGRYCCMWPPQSLETAAELLNTEYVADISSHLIAFYQWYNEFQIELGEFSKEMTSPDEDHLFFETQDIVRRFVAEKPMLQPRDKRDRRALFEAMKSISDASIIAWDGGAELVDLEMKSMSAKWKTWRDTYDTAVPEFLVDL